MAKLLKADLERIVEELQAEVQQLKDKNERLKLRLKETEESLVSANLCADKLAHRCNEYSERIRVLETQNSKLDFEINSTKASHEVTETMMNILDKNCKQYKKEIEQLKEENLKLKDVQKNKNEQSNAGRKPKLTAGEITRIQMLRLQGMSYREIAKDVKCSVGLVHKIINEPIGNIKKRD